MVSALTIAGSDSGGVAGIQADLKTFSALGVHGCTAITAITAQNTVKVSSIFEVGQDVLRDQIRSVLTDIKPNAIKIGMVYSKSTIECVAHTLHKNRSPIVLDPILSAETGVKLMRDDAIEYFISKLIPISTIVTPNVMEAARLTGIDTSSEKGIIEAARTIKGFGAESVVVKGGHSKQKIVTDIVLDSNSSVIRISNSRIAIGKTHGSGCNFSSALTAFIAKGMSLIQACKAANEYVHAALKTTINVGKGLASTNPLHGLYLDANRYQVMTKMMQAIREIEGIENFGTLIPETQSNLVFAIPGASGINDVAGVVGRIVKIGSNAKPASCVEFGASRHVASAILAYMESDSQTRSAINIKFDQKLVKLCRLLFRVSSYDRRAEPPILKKKEGTSVYWGIKSALKKDPRADIIYHTGDIGKEPMILIFGREPSEVLVKVKKILEKDGNVFYLKPIQRQQNSKGMY
jgi:hydroxymethylpyrimidine/phosphomethylpyrimidine kinase